MNKTAHKYTRALGRRKSATAVVKLFKGKQEESPVMVNGIPAVEYWNTGTLKTAWQEPFRVTNTTTHYTGEATIHGSGKIGQLGAFILAVSRALEKIDTEKFRPVLKKHGFLTRDSREKERRKAGLAQKARAKKQSPKR